MWSFRNHSKMLICSLKSIYYYYYEFWNSYTASYFCENHLKKKSEFWRMERHSTNKQHFFVPIFWNVKVFTVKFDPLYVVFLNKCVLFSNSCMVVHVSYCDGTLGRGGLGGLGKFDVGWFGDCVVKMLLLPVKTQTKTTLANLDVVSSVLWGTETIGSKTMIHN